MIKVSVFLLFFASSAFSQWDSLSWTKYRDSAYIAVFGDGDQWKTQTRDWIWIHDSIFAVRWYTRLPCDSLLAHRRLLVDSVLDNDSIYRENEVNRKWLDVMGHLGTTVGMMRDYYDIANDEQLDFDERIIYWYKYINWTNLELQKRFPVTIK